MAGLLSFTATVADGGAAAPTQVGGNPVLTPGSGASQPGASEPAPPSVGPGATNGRPPASFPPYLPAASPPLSSATPPVTPQPSPSPSEPTGIASRIAIPSLRIDLPIVSDNLEVRGNRNNYPLCDVAQYMSTLGQPGQAGTTYIYAHAQRGMFLPLLRASWRSDGAEMVGAIVEVYTTDSQLHLYEIYRVKRHATNLDLAYKVEPGEHRLVLQTSEGPEGTIPKLQVAARPIGVVPTTAEQAMPEPRARACPPPR